VDRADVLRVYGDPEFAGGYNDRFILPDWPMHGVRFELGILRELIDEGDNWLDLGCGTGWVLSQFPDVERAGLDLSSAMLAEARAANPDIPLHQGDFTVERPEFVGQWSVVSCMWMAYCYLESMPEVEALVANMVRYTKPGGHVFLPSVIDLEDLRPHVQVPYEEFPDVWHGRIAITGYNWTWEEANGNVNANMMAVHVGHFVRLLEDHFEQVEVIRYPVFEPGGVSRKAVVARRRHPEGVTTKAEIVVHPAPLHPDDQAALDAAHAEAQAAAAAAEAEQRAAEVAAQEAAEAAQRATAEEAERQATEAQRREAEARQLHEERAEMAKEIAILRHEVEWLRSTYGHLAPPEPDGTVDLHTTTTKRLAKELAIRINPAKPGFTGRVRKRLPFG
jgi:SAM-dependent methyltransferase